VSTPESQLTAADLEQMTPAEILAAYDAGRLADLTGHQVNAPDKDRQLTRDDLQAMTSDQIVEAQEAGQLDHLLGRLP
jgi:hypothetical protein